MTTHVHKFDPDEHARIFGPQGERETGRSRLCTSCGDWHRLDKPWPHNCRKEGPPRADLAVPMLAASFQPFMTGVTEAGEYIGDRKARREYMARNDLVDHETGVTNESWTDPYEERRSIVADIKRAIETDPLNREPVERIGERDLDGANEISTDDVEVIE